MRLRWRGWREGGDERLDSWVTTIDALLARLCTRHELEMLTTDHDFKRMVPQVGLTIWHA